MLSSSLNNHHHEWVYIDVTQMNASDFFRCKNLNESLIGKKGIWWNGQSEEICQNDEKRHGWNETKWAERAKQYTYSYFMAKQINLLNERQYTNGNVVVARKINRQRVKSEWKRKPTILHGLVCFWLIYWGYWQRKQQNSEIPKYTTEQQESERMWATAHEKTQRK